MYPGITITHTSGRTSRSFTPKAASLQEMMGELYLVEKNVAEMRIWGNNCVLEGPKNKWISYPFFSSTGSPPAIIEAVHHNFEKSAYSDDLERWLDESEKYNLLGIARPKTARFEGLLLDMPFEKERLVTMTLQIVCNQPQPTQLWRKEKHLPVYFRTMGISYFSPIS